MNVSLVARASAGIMAATAAGTASMFGAVEPVASSPMPRLTTTEPSLVKLMNNGLLFGSGGGGFSGVGGMLMSVFTVGGGKATMKMISNTSMMSMNGVTLMSEFWLGALFPVAPWPSETAIGFRPYDRDDATAPS